MHPFMNPLRYSVLNRAVALLGLLILVLAILGGMIWRNLQRLDQIQGYITYSHRVEGVSIDLQVLLTDALSGDIQDFSNQVERLQEDLASLNKEGLHLSPKTPEKLQQVQVLLDELQTEPDAATATENHMAMVLALGAMGQIMDDETEQRDHARIKLSDEMHTELNLALVTLTIILLLAAWFVDKRILAPLHDLKKLLARLTEGNFSPITTHHLDPLLEPVFQSYNEMVIHLAELEEDKRRHTHSLQAEVHTATHALLEQQRSLAQAERLAAVGEMAAELAHELRNPLAGIQMACINLQNELEKQEQVERLDLIIAELKRMAHLLNDVLSHSRHTPMPPTDFDAVPLLKELLRLVSYQIPQHIILRLDAPLSLPVRLIETSLRQSILNLVLNAAEALGDTPGTIRVILNTSPQAILLSVIDDGPGFDGEILKQGVQAFHTTRPNGTGLGLAVVKRYVDDQGGQLQLSNCQPHGACATLLLPWAPLK